MWGTNLNNIIRLFFDKDKSLSNILSAFSLLLIFSFCINVTFPLFNSVDFQDLELDMVSEDNSSGDLVNQIYWLLILSLCAIVTVRNKYSFSLFVQSNIFLFFFILTVCISVFWATNFDISLRRVMLFFIVFFCLATAILNVYQWIDVVKILYVTCAIALGLNCISFILGLGFDFEGYFKGIHGHKNSLGPISVMSIYTGIFIRIINKNDINKILNLAYILIWMFFLLISVSKTSIALY